MVNLAGTKVLQFETSLRSQLNALYDEEADVQLVLDSYFCNRLASILTQKENRKSSDELRGFSRIIDEQSSQRRSVMMVVRYRNGLQETFYRRNLGQM